MSRTPRLKLIIGLLLVGGGIALVTGLPVREHLGRFLEWLGGLGTVGLVLIALAYTPACLLFIPGSLLTLGAGFLYGVVPGTIAVSLGSVLGATAAFLVGRFLARDWIADRVARRPAFQALDRAVADQGLKLVLLIRLSPAFPFNLLNYAFGLTNVRLRDYILGSWIGMFPGTVMYVYLGSAVKDLANLLAGKVEGGLGQKLLFFLGLAATVIVTVWATKIAKQALTVAAPTSQPRLETETNHGTLATGPALDATATPSHEARPQATGESPTRPAAASSW